MDNNSQKNFSCFVIIIFVFNITACATQQDSKINTLIEQNQQLQNQIRERDRKEIEPACRFLYEIYRQCYAQGIQNGGDLVECAKTGAILWANVEDKLGARYSETVAKFCALACRSIDKGLPAYEAFEQEYCSVM
jgi:hypothetical protein